MLHMFVRTDKTWISGWLDKYIEILSERWCGSLRM